MGSLLAGLATVLSRATCDLTEALLSLVVCDGPLGEPFQP
jgi:hypothetical protein